MVEKVEDIIDGAVEEVKKMAAQGKRDVVRHVKEGRVRGWDDASRE